MIELLNIFGNLDEVYEAYEHLTEYVYDTRSSTKPLSAIERWGVDAIRGKNIKTIKRPNRKILHRNAFQREGRR